MHELPTENLYFNMKKRSKNKKSTGEIIAIVFVIYIIIKVLTRCDFDQITKKNQPSFTPTICKAQNLSKRECDKKFKKLKTKEFIKIIKERKIKDKNYEPMKPINPHK